MKDKKKITLTKERAREIKGITKQYTYPFSRFIGVIEFGKRVKVKSYVRNGKRVRSYNRKSIGAIVGAGLLTAAYVKRRPLAIGLYKGVHKTPKSINNKLGQVKVNLFNYLAKKSGKKIEVDPKRGYTLWKNKAGDLNSISVVNGHSIEFATNKVATKDGIPLFQMDFKVDDSYALKEGVKSGNRIITEISNTFKSHIKELKEGYIRIKPFADDAIGNKRRSLIFRRYGFTELPDKKDGYLYLAFYKSKPVKINKKNYKAILEDIKGFD